MPLVRHADPAKFLAAARAVIARDEAEGMMLESRVRALLARGPHDHTRCYLATASGRSAKGAAFQLGANPLSLGASDAATAPLFADDLAGEHSSLQGVYGMLEPCERFVGRWNALTGRAHRLRFHMRHHVLTEVAAVPQPSGAPRVAGVGDVDWLIACMHAFIAEANLPDGGTDTSARFQRGVARGLYWIWDDRGPAAFAGWSPATPTSARVAPVYTVPDRRGRGYATALVAALSRTLLATDVRCLSLTTDLANPVSNAIYARVGYRPTSEAWHFDFVSTEAC
jgi:predicted GNAT family acetyltransferase